MLKLVALVKRKIVSQRPEVTRPKIRLRKIATPSMPMSSTRRTTTNPWPMETLSPLTGDSRRARKRLDTSRAKKAKAPTAKSHNLVVRMVV